MSDQPQAESAASGDRVATALGARWAATDRATRGVLAVTALALVARLVALGDRVMHFDEARVAFWALNWNETGAWHYRYIIHGPFIQHVDRWLFATIGPTDFAARLPVAIVGGLLPLAVLLYREHFTDGELVGMAVLLSAQPLLLYYSRFMRSDVLVAAFMFVALGFLVRLWDHGRPRDMYLATAFLALGFASKENAVIYPLCWAGMLVAVGGLELLWPRRFGSREAFMSALVEKLDERAEWALSPASRPWVSHLLGVVALFGAMTLFFYAPRGFDLVQPAGASSYWVKDAGSGLWQGGFDVFHDTVGGIEKGFDHWGGSGDYVEFCSGEDERLTQYADPKTFRFEYLCHMGRQLLILQKTALSLAVLAVVGFVAEVTSDRPRVLVAGAFAWGVASVVGYPAGTDIFYPSWIAVHVVVPMAIPGAVGLAMLVRWGREALDDDDLVGAAVAVGAVVMLLTSMVGIGVYHAYAAPQNGQPDEVNVVQYAQPEGQMQAELRTVRRVSKANDGVDVVVYGQDFVNRDATRLKPACLQWLQPWAAVSWTLYASDANVRCVESRSELSTVMARTNAPIVLSSVSEARGPNATLGQAFAASGPYQAYLSESGENKVVFHFNTSQVDWSEPDERAAGVVAPPRGG